MSDPNPYSPTEVGGKRRPNAEEPLELGSLVAEYTTGPQNWGSIATIIVGMLFQVVAFLVFSWLAFFAGLHDLLPGGHSRWLLLFAGYFLIVTTNTIIACIGFRYIQKKILVFENGLQLKMYIAKPIEIHWQNLRAVEDVKVRKWPWVKEKMSIGMSLNYADRKTGINRSVIVKYENFKNSAEMLATVSRLYERKAW